MNLNIFKKLSLTITLILGLVSCSKPQPKISWPYADTNHEFFGTNFAIASPGFATGRAARQIFDMGGNLVDAAIAASFTVSVERPQSTGLGGGGFMIMKLADHDEVIAVDFRERAPRLASRDMYLNPSKEVISDASTDGIRAVAVPGLVAGLIEIHKKYGKLPIETVLEPAIVLAESGFKVYPHLAHAISTKSNLLSKFPASKALFFKSNGQPLKEGDILRQPELAKTLRAIARQGRDGFYKGWVAKAIIKQQTRLGGLIRQKDLDAYSVKFRAPVSGTYEGLTVFSMPPPSSGGVHIIQILNILEGKLDQRNPLSPRAIHLTSSAMQLAFSDRAKYLGDPDFVDVPTGQLISKNYAREISKAINPTKATPSKQLPNINARTYESDQTTHISLMDHNGNAIATTQTVNGYLGSGVVVEGAGFVLNNEMDDFSVKPGVPNMFGAIGGEENAISPLKTPLSSMSPTIVMKEKKPLLVIGAPGGTRIISCVLLTMLNYLHYKMPLDQSVNLVRYHHQWLPDEIRVEHPKLPAVTTSKLESMGHTISNKPYGCQVQAVAFEKNHLHAVADPRDVGLATGGN